MSIYCLLNIYSMFFFSNKLPVCIQLHIALFLKYKTEPAALYSFCHYPESVAYISVISCQYLLSQR